MKNRLVSLFLAASMCMVSVLSPVSAEAPVKKAVQTAFMDDETDDSPGVPEDSPEMPVTWKAPISQEASSNQGALAGQEMSDGQNAADSQGASNGQGVLDGKNAAGNQGTLNSQEISDGQNAAGSQGASNNQEVSDGLNATGSQGTSNGQEVSDGQNAMGSQGVSNSQEISDGQSAPDGQEIPDSPEEPDNLETSDSQDGSDAQDDAGFEDDTEIFQPVNEDNSQENPQSFRENTDIADMEDFEYTMITNENSENLLGDSPESQALVKDIQSGEVVAFAPVADDFLEESATVSTMSLDAEAAAAAVSPGKYVLTSYDTLYCDEVWTKTNGSYPNPGNGATYTDPRFRAPTVQRKITYIDSKGEEKTSQLYCLEAQKGGTGISPGSGGTNIKDNATSFITNSAMKNFLYFGYGGPGDVCDNYDPTCSHIDWSKARNRYIFTHIALSKTWSGDVGNATAEEVEHTGINRWRNYLKSLTIPDRTNVQASFTNAAGATVQGKTVWMDMTLYPVKPSNGNWNWLENTNGFQISPRLKLTDAGNCGNGISITRPKNADWQLGYWNDKADYDSRGLYNPRVLAKGDTVVLKDHSFFRIVLPLQTTATRTMQFTDHLKPVSFLLVDGEKQTGQSDVQDLGAYVFQGNPGMLTLYLVPHPPGRLTLFKKNASDNSILVSGASYALYSADKIYSGSSLWYEANKLIQTGVTNAKGEIHFENLLPGKYYVKETAEASGYYLDTSTYPVTITSNQTSTLSVTDIPVPKQEYGSITVTKKIKEADIIWAHGNPTFTFAAEGRDVGGTYRKYEGTVVFKPGSYTLDAEGYAVLQVTFPKVPLGQYEVYEKQVLRYYLKNAVSGSSNMTVIRGNAPAYGLAPKSIAYGKAALDSQKPDAAITFINEKKRYDGYSHTSYIKNTIPVIF